MGVPCPWKFQHKVRHPDLLVREHPSAGPSAPDRSVVHKPRRIRHRPFGVSLLNVHRPKSTKKDPFGVLVDFGQFREDYQSARPPWVRRSFQMKIICDWLLTPQPYPMSSLASIRASVDYLFCQRANMPQGKSLPFPFSAIVRSPYVIEPPYFFSNCSKL